ncbi:hypothetical protein Metev_0749 [Methanohalobium evestigatum Z-7303]|uniref:Uncharacterized protein n=1 Tax=Methanohalobium evestigatum (strain ATCC BAA-1072 / DSM 3721 / NBRC 107634 / OCM 161 / Z-7303) TaxID=644295 RepID=D7E726_METEZ|nr:hypothetical protein [Methanohalobium evestigatum]ADI73650.1 hypothetical protein Metev_0749 [Methanohalobium evestigatum Z-7303]
MNNRLKNHILSVFTVFLIGLAVGISVPMFGVQDVETNDCLEVVESTTSLGALDENNTNIQIYSYNFTLYNGNEHKLLIKTFKPEFSQNFSDIIVTKNTTQIINKSIEPEGFIQIKNDIRLNTTGLSKEELLELEPFIQRINITSVTSHPIPGG